MTNEYLIALINLRDDFYKRENYSSADLVTKDIQKLVESIKTNK